MSSTTPQTLTVLGRPVAVTPGEIVFVACYPPRVLNPAEAREMAAKLIEAAKMAEGKK